MAYDPHTWIHEEVIYARLLNNLEEGVQDALSGLATEQLRATTAENAKINSSLIGVANGVASLGANGKVPLAQLPPIGGGVQLTATLLAGATSVTITDEAIGDGTLFHLMTETGVAPTNQSISGTTYTATFETQLSDMDICLEVV